MSTVLVCGGTGALGRHVVERLRQGGDDVRVLSRRPGAGTHTGDLSTGSGVADAASGAELIVDAASDVRRLGRSDPRQTEHLLGAAGEATHLLYISIVGIDSIPFAYYRRKVECERLIAASGIPFTILRATQFHELIAFMLRGVERLPLAPLPLDFRFQTVAPAEVAAKAAELLHRQPTGERVDFGGPEVLPLGEMASVWRAVRGRPRRVARLRVPGEIGTAFRQGRNTCPDHAEGHLTWAQFVASEPANPYRLFWEAH